MRRSTACTLQDVAREAGVSAMTVSVVLNGARTATRVSDATRERILEAAARLRYRPNAAARGLQRRRMETIGVVAVIDHGPDADLNLYFLEVLNGILEEASAHGQNTTVLSISGWEGADREKVLQFCDGRVDGMILIAPRMGPGFAEALHHHTPFVAIHAEGMTGNIWNLDIDNEEGAYKIVRHLIEAGHRRILHLAGPLELAGPQHRRDGYLRALREAGIEPAPEWVVPGDYYQKKGEEVMAGILQSGRFDPLPTAVFAASDAIATGASRAIIAQGLRIPDDISLAGFDDSLNARINDPPLTTVRQPFRQFGHQAVDLLLRQISIEGSGVASALPTTTAAADPEVDLEEVGKDAEVAPTLTPHTLLLPVEVVQRASVGPPPSGRVG